MMMMVLTMMIMMVMMTTMMMIDDDDDNDEAHADPVSVGVVPGVAGVDCRQGAAHCKHGASSACGERIVRRTRQKIHRSRMCLRCIIYYVMIVFPLSSKALTCR